MTEARKQFSRIPPFNPAKRARAIQNAIAKGEIKPNEVLEDILVLLEQVMFLEEKSA
jgi:hypothetical protein